MKPGDIILVHSGRSLLARGITYYMKLYLKRLGYDWRDFPYIPHHAGTIVDVWGELHVAEALGRGYVIQPLNVAYTEKEWETRVVIKEPVRPYTEEGYKSVSKEAIGYSLKGVPYEYFNFLHQIIWIKTGIWIGKNGEKAQDRFYCSEVAATLAAKIQPWTFPSPERINPVDILLSDYFR